MNTVTPPEAWTEEQLAAFEAREKVVKYSEQQQKDIVAGALKVPGSYRNAYNSTLGWYLVRK